MAFKTEYLKKVYANVEKKDADQPEFLQAVKEVLESLEPVIEQRPDLVKAGIIERIIEPERIVTFRVSWVDDAGNVQCLILIASKVLLRSLINCDHVNVWLPDE